MTLRSVFAKRFEKARLDAWQGYYIVGFQEGDYDPRNETFERLKETIDTSSAALLERAQKFLSADAARFHYFLNNMTEEVGMGLAPENASAFVAELVQRLEIANPEDAWKWAPRPPGPDEDDVPFCEPDHVRFPAGRHPVDQASDYAHVNPPQGAKA